MEGGREGEGGNKGQGCVKRRRRKETSFDELLDESALGGGGGCWRCRRTEQRAFLVLLETNSSSLPLGVLPHFLHGNVCTAWTLTATR